MIAMWGVAGVAVLALAMWAARSLMQPAVMAPGAVLEAGAVFRDCPTCPLMKVLKPGKFDQGTAEGAADALPFEQPVRAVTIAYPLAAGVNEITVGEFAEFTRDYPRDRVGCTTYDGEWRQQADVSWRNAMPQQNSSFPVTCVSWQDAADYAAWLSLRTGASYRLPSASEWEYLARAGGASLPWANASEACAYANAADASAIERFPGWTAFACSDNYAEASPVGTFEANAFGLNDTLGNVFEWTQDCWRDDYKGAPADGAASQGGDCTQREARGGSWFTTPAYVRPAYRNRFDAEYRGSSLGFRLVREIKNAN